MAYRSLKGVGCYRWRVGTLHRSLLIFQQLPYIISLFSTLIMYYDIGNTFPAPWKGWIQMDENNRKVLTGQDLVNDPGFIEACRKALQDPEKKALIINILQCAELSQSSSRQTA